jgi:hypothetical protein
MIEFRRTHGRMPRHDEIMDAIRSAVEDGTSTTTQHQGSREAKMPMDGWHRPLDIKIDGDTVTLRSAGQDGEFRNEDDAVMAFQFFMDGDRAMIREAGRNGIIGDEDDPMGDVSNYLTRPDGR